MIGLQTMWKHASPQRYLTSCGFKSTSYRTRRHVHDFIAVPTTDVGAEADVSSRNSQCPVRTPHCLPPCYNAVYATVAKTLVLTPALAVNLILYI